MFDMTGPSAFYLETLLCNVKEKNEQLNFTRLKCWRPLWRDVSRAKVVPPLSFGIVCQFPLVPLELFDICDARLIVVVMTSEDSQHSIEMGDGMSTSRNGHRGHPLPGSLLQIIEFNSVAWLFVIETHSSRDNNAIFS